MSLLERALWGCLAWGLLASTAHATWGVKYPDGDISIGPSLSLMKGEPALGLDLGYTVNLLTASANFERFEAGGRDVTFTRLELTVWFLANIGGGVGAFQRGAEVSPVTHFFLGVPLGDDVSRAWRPFRSMYIEPYYRANVLHPDAGGTEVLHEWGLLLKMTTYRI